MINVYKQSNVLALAMNACVHVSVTKSYELVVQANKLYVRGSGTSHTYEVQRVGYRKYFDSQCFES